MPAGLLHSDIKRSKQTEELIVRHPSPAQYDVHLRLLMDVWGDGLELKQALARSLHIRATPFLKRMSIFVLVPKDDPETLDLRCIGELMPVPLLLCPAGSTGPPERRRAFTVDDVACPPKWRGNACASASSATTPVLDDAVDAALMSRLVLEHVRDDPELHPHALLGFSDAGLKVWEPIGCSSFPAFETVWSVDDLPVPSNDHYARLSLDDIKALAPLDARLLGARLSRRDATKTRFCVAPTADMYESYLEQTFETLRHMRGARRIPSHHGVRLGDEVYAIWIHLLQDDALCFLRLQASTADQVARLVGAATAEAKWWGLKRIVAWDLDDALLLDETTGEPRWPGVRASKRNHALPVAVWLGDEGDELDWLVERYALVLEA